MKNEFAGEPNWQDSQMGACPLRICIHDPLGCMYHHGGLVGNYACCCNWHWNLCRFSHLEEPSWGTMVRKEGKP